MPSFLLGDICSCHILAIGRTRIAKSEIALKTAPATSAADMLMQCPDPSEFISCGIQGIISASIIER